MSGPCVAVDGALSKRVIEMTSENSNERYRVRPWYLCIDRSGSMGPKKGQKESESPIAQVNRDLQTLLVDEFHKDDDVREVIRLGVMSFADEARVDVPLCDATHLPKMPELEANGHTSYSAVFRLAREVIQKDYESTTDKWFRPVFALVTDGRPWPETRSAWEPTLADLRSEDWLIHPIFAVFGFGNADESLLESLLGMKSSDRSLCSAPGHNIAFLASKEQTPSLEVHNILRNFQKSVLNSAAARGEVRVEETLGVRILGGDQGDALPDHRSTGQS